MASLRDIGQSLKEAREAQNVALEDISARTHITVRHLMALEEGNEADLPEVFYVRGFLKKYAESVGLSPKEVADAYRAAPVPTTTPSTTSSSAGPIIYYVLIAALFAGMLYLAWYFQPKLSVVAEPSPSPGHHLTHPKPSASMGLAASGAATATGPAVVAPSPAKASPAGSPKPSAKPSLKPAAAASPPADSAMAAIPPVPSAADPSAKPSVRPSDKVTVELTIEQRAWVEVKVDGQPALEGLLSPKAHKAFKGKSVTVSAGNAGGVRITVNGHDRGFLGQRGVVVAKTFKP